MNTPHDDPTLPDEGLIHEWLDGQLDADTSAHLDTLVQRSPEFAARVAEARGFVAASSRILSALDEVPAGVLPRPQTPAADTGVRSIVSARARRRTFTWQRWASAAAVLLVAVTGTMLWQRTPASDTVSGAADRTGMRAVAAVGTPSAEVASDMAAAAAAAPRTPALSADAGPNAPTPAAPPAVAAREAAPPAASARAAAPPAPAAPASIAPAADAVLSAQLARSGRVAAAEMASAEGASFNVTAKSAAAAPAAAPAETRALLGADAMRAAPANAAVARSLSASPETVTELTPMRSDLLADDLFVAVQRVECTTQCRQIRVEIARDGRLRRWTSTFGRSNAADSARITPAVLTRLTALSDSLTLQTLPPVVPLMGAQCRTVGALRESLRVEFRHEGQMRAVTALPWCDTPAHPLAIMARAVEQAATEQLGAP